MIRRREGSGTGSIIRLTVMRSRAGGTEAHPQTFLYEAESGGDTVATALLVINARADLRDEDGNFAEPVMWESSCLQKRCGACAMRINGEPRLACDTPLAGLPDRILLEPLRKFPVIADLLTDRGVMQRNLMRLGVWMETEASPDEKRMWDTYDASRCLQCGLCLEVCPNYAADGEFTGAASAVPASRVFSASGGAEAGRLADRYRKYVFEGCGKSLACEHVCPAEIPVGERLSQSNAAAVWKRLIFNRRNST